MADDDVWFEPKRYGYGAGLPVRWQGWALLIGSVAVIFCAVWLSKPERPLASFAVILFDGIATGLIAARHTRGGWRWRWGGKP